MTKKMSKEITDNHKYKFKTCNWVTASELGQLIEILSLRINENVYNSLPESLKRLFVDTSKKDE